MRERAVASSSPSRATSACSTRSRHSPNSDSWTHSGTTATVKATPICAIAIRRKCPMRTGSHICKMSAVDGQPLGLRP